MEPLAIFDAKLESGPAPSGPTHSSNMIVVLLIVYLEACENSDIP